MTSIAAVAKAAGVSIATVSRVVNHLPQVAPETAAAVQRAMADLGYHPTPIEHRRPRDTRMASWPAGVDKGSVALLFPDHREVAMRTALSGRLMHGLNDALSPLGLTMLTTPLTAEGALPPMILRRAVDGVIVRTTIPVETIARNVPADLPIVWLMETVEADLGRGDQVLEDTAAIARLAARHLLERGHRHVATATSDPLHPCYSRRIAAFTAEITAAGGSVLSVAGDPATPLSQLNALATELLAGPRRPTGLFIPLMDDATVAIHRGLTAQGVIPGKDIQIVATSNDPHLLAALDPSLVNISIHAEEIARVAGELLLWRLANPQARRRKIIIEPSIGPVTEP